MLARIEILNAITSRGNISDLSAPTLNYMRRVAL